MNYNSLSETLLSKAMALCSQREYCRDDIRTKLRSWGAGETDMEKILSALVRENFLNETRYASAFVRDKFNYNKWRKVKIAAHLRAKQIAPGIITSALNLIDDELYMRNMKEIITAHRRHVKAKNHFDLKGKLLRFGLSKGFESNQLYDLLNDLD